MKNFVRTLTHMPKLCNPWIIHQYNNIRHFCQFIMHVFDRTFDLFFSAEKYKKIKIPLDYPPLQLTFFYHYSVIPQLCAILYSAIFGTLPRMLFDVRRILYFLLFFSRKVRDELIQKTQISIKNDFVILKGVQI